MFGTLALAHRRVAHVGSTSSSSIIHSPELTVKATKPSWNSSRSCFALPSSLLRPTGLNARSLHSSARLQSEDLYDFQNEKSETRKRRKSSSQSTSSSPARLTRTRTSSPTSRIRTPLRGTKPRTSSPESAKKPRWMPKKTAEEIETETVTKARRYREEADTINIETFSEHPKIRMARVSFEEDGTNEVKSKRRTEVPRVDAMAIMPTVVIDGLNPKYGVDTLPLNAAVRPGVAADEEQVLRAKAIAEQLSIPFYPSIAQMRSVRDLDFTLVVGGSQIALVDLHADPPTTVFSDFIAGPTAHRKSTGGADPKSPIMRAVRVTGKSISETHLLDATGGLGVDGFMFASAGFNVTMLEKNPLVYTLLLDALKRAEQVPHLKNIVARIRLHHIDAFEWFTKNANTSNAPDVIYLDPMYPIESKMKAMPKKGMALARSLTGRKDRADELVRQALKCATDKVVLKRPYYSAESKGTSMVRSSRSLRFEVFTQESWKKVGHPDEERVPSPPPRTLLQDPL